MVLRFDEIAGGVIGGRGWTVWLIGCILVSVMSFGEAVACQVTDVDLHVAETESGAQGSTKTAVTLCVGNTAWVRVDWTAIDSGPDADNEFSIKIQWEQGTDHWVTIRTESAGKDDRMKIFELTQLVDPDAYTIRATVRRLGTDHAEISNQECLVKIVEVEQVTEDDLTECLSRSVRFTAEKNPAGGALNCIEWQKRYRPDSGSAWGSWGGAEGGDNLADLYGSAGQYQYRARNGPGDTWKASSEDPPVMIVEVDKIEINANGSWYDVTEQEIVVLAGTKYTFRALPNPSDAAWPAGSPKWYYGMDSETGETIEVGFNAGGTKTLTGECCCDAGKKTVTIKVIYPEPDEVSFVVPGSCGSEYDIYGITDPVWKRENDPDDNKPASYGKFDCIKIEPKFWAADELTFVTPDVEIKPVGLGGFIFEAADVTFGTLWPAPAEAVGHESVSRLENSIGTTSLDIRYDYRVPWGTNQWIMMAELSGTHKVYRVWGQPIPSLADILYIEANLDICTGWADGCTKIDTSDDSTNIPRKVQLGAKHWFFDLYGYEGGNRLAARPVYIHSSKQR